MKKKRKNFFRRFWDAFWRPEMLVLPGQTAFFLFLSIVPTITLIGYACAYLKISNPLIELLLNNTIGREFGDLLTPILTSTKITPAFFITLGIGYFIASQGMSSIIVASNTIYGIKDSGFFKRRLKAIIMELIIVFLFIFIITVPLLGENIISLLVKYDISGNATDLFIKTIKVLKGPFSWLVIYFFIKLIYTMAPDRKIPSRNVTGGAIFTTIGWIIITAVYSYYITRWANYSAFYGTLANIVILMVWLYFLSYVLVIGMAMNYHEELEKTGIIAVKDIINESANNTSFVEQEQKEEDQQEIIEEKKEEDQQEIIEEKKEEKKLTKPKKSTKKTKK